MSLRLTLEMPPDLFGKDAILDDARPLGALRAGREGSPWGWAATMNLDLDVIDHFKGKAAETGIPYQRLINLYLSRCAEEGKRLAFV